MGSVFGHLNSRIFKSISNARAQFFDMCFFNLMAQQHSAMASSFTRFLHHTQRRNTVGRTPLAGWSVPRRDLYLTTYNTRNRQTSMPPVGSEPTISAGERPQTYALDHAATGIGLLHVCLWKKKFWRQRKPGLCCNTFQIGFYRVDCKWMTSKRSGHLASSIIVYTGQK